MAATEASWEYQYDSGSGRVRKVVARDELSQVRRQYLYSDDLRRQDFRDAYDLPKPLEGSDISQELRELDERGYVRRLRFANLYGSPRANGDGAYGFDYTLQVHGLPVQERVLGADGQPATTKAWFVGTASPLRRFRQRDREHDARRGRSAGARPY